MAWWDPSTWFGSTANAVPSGGGTWDLSAGATPTDLASAASAMNIAAPTATGGGTWDLSSGAATPQASSPGLGAALQKLGEQFQQQNQGQANKGPGQAPLQLGSVGSTFSRGGGSELGQLVQMLMARGTQYGAPASTQVRGLLGL